MYRSFFLKYPKMLNVTFFLLLGFLRFIIIEYEMDLLVELLEADFHAICLNKCSTKLFQQGIGLSIRLNMKAVYI